MEKRVVNSGSLHGLVYDVFVFYNANRLVAETGISKYEAIKLVEEAVSREDYKIILNQNGKKQEFEI